MADDNEISDLGVELNPDSVNAYADDRYRKAVDVLKLMEEKLPSRQAPYSVQTGEQVAHLYIALGEELEDEALVDHGLEMLLKEIAHFAPHVPYLSSLIADKEMQRGPFNSKPVTVYNLEVTAVDRYIPYYLYQMMDLYKKSGGGEEALSEVLVKAGGDKFAGQLAKLLEGIE